MNLRILALLTMPAHLASCAGLSPWRDPLPSWREGPAKQEIIEFVHKVTDESSVHFVPPAARIAAFDNDGTLWCEQ